VEATCHRTWAGRESERRRRRPAAGAGLHEAHKRARMACNRSTEDACSRCVVCHRQLTYQLTIVINRQQCTGLTVNVSILYNKYSLVLVLPVLITYIIRTPQRHFLDGSVPPYSDLNQIWHVGRGLHKKKERSNNQ